jgi:hypothetical protein
MESFLVVGVMDESNNIGYMTFFFSFLIIIHSSLFIYLFSLFWVRIPIIHRLNPKPLVKEKILFNYIRVSVIFKSLVVLI